MKIIDLFSGAGGFSLGFQKAGFDTILAIDFWEDAINTFNNNLSPDLNVAKHMDIHDYTDDKIEQLLLKHDPKNIGIIGGPPCQGFSMVGTRDHNDERNSLYLEYVRFAEKIRPAFFVLENVKGLLSMKKGYFKDDIIQRFTELGYNVDYKVLKASDYGVPQNRERVFFVGLNKEIFGDKYMKWPSKEKNIITTEDALSDLPNLDAGDDKSRYKTPPLNLYQKMMRKNSEVVYNNDITNHQEKTIEIIKLVPDGKSIKDVSSELYKVRNYNAAFKRMDSRKPSATVDCGHRNYFHYKENRVPTVRENARLQSFPDTFIFTGSKTSQYTQVGNAVPPLLSEKLANSIKNLFYSIS